MQASSSARCRLTTGFAWPGAAVRRTRYTSVSYTHLDVYKRQGLSTSLFAYYRPAIANNLDDDSPLGVSIYANALSTLQALDICYDSFVQEFRLGRKRIIVPAQCLRTVQDLSLIHI